MRKWRPHDAGATVCMARRLSPVRETARRGGGPSPAPRAEGVRLGPDACHGKFRLCERARASLINERGCGRWLLQWWASSSTGGRLSSTTSRGSMDYEPAGAAPPGACSTGAAHGSGSVGHRFGEAEEQFEQYAREKIGPYTQRVGIPGPPQIMFYDVHGHRPGSDPTIGVRPDRDPSDAARGTASDETSAIWGHLVCGCPLGLCGGGVSWGSR